MTSKLLLPTIELLPSEISNINWKNIWERPISDGTGFHWAVVAAISKELVEHGWTCEIPLLGFPEVKDLLVYRNEIPLTHLSQPGHSASSWDSVTLAQRFFQALIPKMTFGKDGYFFSLFVEGCPYHIIAKGKEYDIRPDIVLFPGRLEEINQEGSTLTYKYKYDDSLLLTGTLRIGNSKILPLIHKTPTDNLDLKAVSIIECSVNKKEAIALPQIMKYWENFTFSGNNGVVLVTGNKLGEECGPSIQVDLSKDSQELLTSLKEAGKYIYSRLSLPAFVEK